MSEWRSVWTVRIKYAHLADNDGFPFRDVRAETPAQLRRIVEWARANPQVVGFPYKRIRERYGPEPVACRHGHPYDGMSAVRALRNWADCPCGGHFVIACRRQGCTEVETDPRVTEDCAPAVTAVIDLTRRSRDDRR